MDKREGWLIRNVTSKDAVEYVNLGKSRDNTNKKID